MTSPRGNVAGATGNFTTTYVALRGLTAFRTADQQKLFEKRREQVRERLDLRVESVVGKKPEPPPAEPATDEKERATIQAQLDVQRNHLEGTKAVTPTPPTVTLLILCRFIAGIGLGVLVVLFAILATAFPASNGD